jgi:hypothetical protein
MEDMNHFLRYTMFRNRGVKTVLLLIGFSAILNFIFSSKNLNIFTWIIPAIIFLVFFILFRHRMVSKTVKRAFNDSQFEVSLTEEDLRYSNSDHNIQYSWNKISRIAETQHAYYLYMNKQPSLIFPKHCFKSTDEAQNVANYVRKKIGQTE